MARRWVQATISASLLAAWLASALAGAAQAKKLPLLPLARGQVTVLLGDQPDWLPVSGQATQLTLLAGPATHAQRGANAYVALQGSAQGCARSAQADRAPKLTLTGFFSNRNLLGGVSALAPAGGAERGVYGAVRSITIHQRRSVRACIWIARTPAARTRPVVQQIPLLNGLFAASVSAPADGSGGSPRSYAMDAMYVLSPMRYRVRATVCGVGTTDPVQAVATGDQASELFTIGSGNCPADDSTFSFSTRSGRSLGTLSYTDVDALAQPPVVAHLGACDLNGAVTVTRAAAVRYVSAVGCRVTRLLTQPYDRSLPRGRVAAVQIDGGLAQVAPRGTAVDLVLNG